MSGVSRLHTFPLLTGADLDNTPSRRDGVTPGQESKLWRRMGAAIYETAKELTPKMSAGTAAIAMTFVARFYSMRSLLRNHPPLIAAAALFLAGKCNDEPRSLNILPTEFMKRWYGRSSAEQAELRAAMAAPGYAAALHERMMEAEQALMFALKFDFNVRPLISDAWGKVRAVPALAAVRDRPRFQQFVLATCNDVYKRDAAMLLLFRNEDMALAIIQLFFKVARQQGRPEDVALEPPLDPGTGAAWYVAQGLSEATRRAIFKRFQAFYTNIQRQEGEEEEGGEEEAAGPAATGTASMGGGAASSGDKTGAGGAGGSRGGRRMVSIRQRTAAAKRPRSALEEEETQKQKQQYFFNPEATAAAAGGPAPSESLGGGGVGSWPSLQQPAHGYALSSQYSQLYSDLDAPPAGQYGGGRPAAPPPAPAADDDDELEEGEIEEGEIR